MATKKMAEQVAELIPADKSVGGAKFITIGDKTFVVEQASTFKTLEAIRLLSQVAAVIDIDSVYGEWAAILDEKRQGDLATYVSVLVIKLLPKVSGKAPDLLVEIAAFLTMTNAELRESYRAPNGLADKVKERKEWLYFDCPPSAPLYIIENYLDSLGLDALKNAAMPVLKRIGNLTKA